MKGLQRRRLERELGESTLIHIFDPNGPDDRDEFEDDEIPCCMGSVQYGPRGCTCWVPVYDLEQAEPDLSTQPTTREKCCDDCAYRNDSPERLSGYSDDLRELAGTTEFFACHKGMRRVVAWRHPNGRELPGGDGDYRPPVLGSVAFLADGSPAAWCAGWSACRRALLGSAE